MTLTISPDQIHVIFQYIIHDQVEQFKSYLKSQNLLTHTLPWDDIVYTDLNALELAVKYKSLNFVKYLVTDCHMTINLPRFAQTELLVYRAVENFDYDMIQYLLNCGARATSSSSYASKTCLLDAVEFAIIKLSLRYLENQYSSVMSQKQIQQFLDHLWDTQSYFYIVSKLITLYPTIQPISEIDLSLIRLLATATYCDINQYHCVETVEMTEILLLQKARKSAQQDRLNFYYFVSVSDYILKLIEREEAQPEPDHAKINFLSKQYHLFLIFKANGLKQNILTDTIRQFLIFSPRVRTEEEPFLDYRSRFSRRD